MCIEIPSIAATHLLIGLFVFVAGDGHHVRPIGWLHDDSGEEGTGDMEGRGAVVQRSTGYTHRRSAWSSCGSRRTSAKCIEET